MPDVTSTLLAMYQQIIGGSSATEQASLEAECARRVITAGLTIAGTGTITVPGTLTVSGTLAVNNLTVSGSFVVTGALSVPGTLTVGTLAVTANATIGGTLGVTGTTTLGALTVTGAAGIGGTLTASALTVTGAVGVGGLLTVNGFGQNAFGAAGAGINSVVIRNSQAGTANLAALYVGNDANATLTTLQSLSSTYTSAAYALANSSVLVGAGAGGLSLVTTVAAAAVRLYTNSAERLRILGTGEVCVNATTFVGAGQLSVAGDNTAHNSGIAIQNLSATNTLYFLACYNSVGGFAGAVQHNGLTTVNFLTASDVRLKVDTGLATDLAALRGVRVHDFRWKADLLPDRGVFAQEAYALYPRAVTIGTDDRTASGDLAQPWMADYSKFVPDLIVGWQQHDAVLTELRIAIDGLRDRLKGAA